jgi:hypothetical protein
MLTLTVVEANRTNDEDFIGRIQIDISQLSHQKSVEHWFDLKLNDDVEETKGRVNLNLWWVHSKIDMLRNLIAVEEGEIQVNEENLAYYEDKIEILKLPLDAEKPKDSKNTLGGARMSPDKSFNMSANNTINSTSKSPDKTEFDNLTLAKLVGTVMEREQRWALSFENTSNNLSMRLGFDETPWYIFFQISMFTSMLLTFICCLYKPDFINLTVSALTFFLTANIGKVKQWHLRFIAFMILISWI